MSRRDLNSLKLHIYIFGYLIWNLAHEVYRINEGGCTFINLFRAGTVDWILKRYCPVYMLNRPSCIKLSRSETARNYRVIDTKLPAWIARSWLGGLIQEGYYFDIATRETNAGWIMRRRVIFLDFRLRFDHERVIDLNNPAPRFTRWRRARFNQRIQSHRASVLLEQATQSPNDVAC